MLKAGQVAPLDELYTEDIRKDFHPRDLAANSADGHIYGVTMIDDTGLLYCRRSMLEAAGVKPPTTMDELIQAAKRLTTRNTKGLFVGNDGGVAALMHLVPWSAGSDFLVDNKIVFDNPRTVAAYEKIVELNASGALLIGAPTDWLDFNAFTEGMCAMQWTGLWAYPDIKQRLGDDVVAVAWPAFDAAGSPATFSGGWSAMVNARSRQLAEAKRYVQWQWIQSAHIQKDWCVGYGFHIPPRRSVEADTEAFKSGIPAVAAANFEKYGRILPPAWSNAMTTALSDALANILKKNRPAAAEVSAAAAKCSQELKQLLA
jgi:multiple sugar transport system substrate-binding protein